MRVLYSEAAIRRKYGVTWSEKICKAAAKLGTADDVSGKSADDILGSAIGHETSERRFTPLTQAFRAQPITNRKRIADEDSHRAADGDRQQ